MVKRQLIWLFAALCLAGCQTDAQRITAAAQIQGRAQAASILPDTLPDVCTAKTGRVYPKVGEKARWTQKRWEILAENRDSKSVQCADFWQDFRKNMAKK